MGSRFHCERCLNPSRARACTTRAFTIEIKKVYDSGRIAPPARCVVSVAATTKNSPTADPDPDRRAHSFPPYLARWSTSVQRSQLRVATIAVSHPSLPFPPFSSPQRRRAILLSRRGEADFGQINNALISAASRYRVTRATCMEE